MIPIEPPPGRLPVPDLPAFDSANPLTLRAACNLGLVTAGKGGRLSASQLQRWATRGFRPVAGGPAYVFPTTKGSRERVTCAAWCRAWSDWIKRARAAEARRQMESWERCKRAVGAV
jgi:hypothetical protein